MPNANDDVLTLPSGLPRGDVILNSGTGALGSWRAHHAIDAMAGQIAEGVRATVATAPGARVLVVSDRAVLDGDWTARYVSESLDRLANRVRDLKADLATGQDQLTTGISDCRTADEKQQDDAGERRGAGSGALPAGAIPPGTFSTAVGLLGLVRTDYTLTASSVTSEPSELATLAAAHLARQQVAVEADVLTTAAASPTLRRLAGLLVARDAAVEAISELQQHLAPAESELAALAASGQRLEQEWAQATAGAQPGGANAEGSPLATLRLAADAAADMASRRELVVAPARVLNDHARLVVAEVDAGIAALTQGPDASAAPVHAAVRWERLRRDDGTPGAVTHVLYVKLDAIAADMVTRRSILGMSGLLRVLATGNASWSLLDASSAQIVAGSHVSHAGVMSFSLGNSKASHDDIPAQPGATARLKNPALLAEIAAKALVVILALVLAALGVLSVLAVIRVAVR